MLRFAVLFVPCILSYACAIADTKAVTTPVLIRDGDVEITTYLVEIADDTRSRQQGLMYREFMPANQGMLLYYRRPARMAIWMKNTLIPLDLLFVDASGKIVKIHRDAEPYSLESIHSEVKVKAVLEVNAGQVDAYNIKAGHRLVHPDFFPVPPHDG